MRMRTVLIGVFALVFGTSAAVGVYLMMGAAPVSPKVETVAVLVAASDINRGQTVAAELFTVREWPKEMVPEGAITNPEDVFERTVSIPLLKGELLLEGKLATKGAGRGLAAIIPAGMRAVTIQTPNVATGVGGFIMPGNKVDVLLTISNQGAADQTGGGSTITLLQNLEILAVDQQTDVPDENRVDTKELRSVTLLATPADAARLDLGQNKGTLRLTLRNPTDEATDFVNPVTLTGLNLNPADVYLAPIVPAPVEVATIEPAPIVVAPVVVAPIEATPVAALPVAPPAVIPPPKKRSIPEIRTLRGTQGGAIQLFSPDDDPPEPTAADPSVTMAVSSTTPSGAIRPICHPSIDDPYVRCS